MKKVLQLKGRYSYMEQIPSVKNGQSVLVFNFLCLLDTILWDVFFSIKLASNAVISTPILQQAVMPLIS